MNTRTEALRKRIGIGESPGSNLCLMCGEEYDHIHHIHPSNFGGSDDVKNLIALCSNCHKEMHKAYRAFAFYVSLQVDPLFFEKVFEYVSKFGMLDIYKKISAAGINQLSDTEKEYLIKGEAWEKEFGNGEKIVTGKEIKEYRIKKKKRAQYRKNKKAKRSLKNCDLNQYELVKKKKGKSKKKNKKWYNKFEKRQYQEYNKEKVSQLDDQ